MRACMYVHSVVAFLCVFTCLFVHGKALKACASTVGYSCPGQERGSHFGANVLLVDRQIAIVVPSPLPKRS